MLENGRVLYRLRRHDEAILSFSWCPSQHHTLQKQENVVANATASAEQEANSDISVKTGPAEISHKTAETEKEKAEGDLILDISANTGQETKSVQSSSEINLAETSAETTESLKTDKVKAESDLLDFNTPPRKSTNSEQKTSVVKKEDNSETPLRDSVKTKKSNPWANLIPADNKKSNESRPIPQHFDVSSDCFAEEDNIFEDQHKIENLINPDSGPEEKKPVLETEKKEDDFLAACVALKKQILLNKQPNDDIIALKEPNSLTQSLETVSEKLAKVDLGTDEVSNKSLEKTKVDELNQVSIVESAEDKEKEEKELSSCDEKRKKEDEAECSTKSDTKGVLLASSSRGG